MELFKILGTVAIDGSGAKSELQDVTGAAEESQSKIAGAFEKIGSAAVAIGKTVGAGLAVASTAVAGLAKSALDGYAEYEQLVGGVETLFKDSAGKVQEYANNAYKTAGLSANEYMSTVTSFSASLLQSLASSTSDAGEMSVEATVESLEKQYAEVEESNEKKLELLEEAHESELEAFEELTEQKIALIDKQYKENLKLIDEEKYNKIKAIDEQIDALNAQTQAEKDAIKQREQEQKIASLKEKILIAETSAARAKAQQDLEDLLADIAQEAREKERKAQIESLKDQKDLIKEEADEKKEILKEQYEAEKQAAKDASADQLKEIKKAQKAETDALKKSNKAKLAEMGAYVEEQVALIEQSSSGMVYTAETYEQAAEKANMAIIDMSDNANKMGTDMASIQNAYQGFAKQNFTMLDNLKLGYSGTKEEMERLLADAQAISGIEYDVSSYADIVDAIHVIQTEMGITGTTAKEASTTIQGSFDSMKAAWTNLITGLGNEGADLTGLIDQFVASADTVMSNVLPRIEIILGGITDLIAQIMPKIAERLPELLNTALPSLIEAAVQLFNGLVKALPTILQILIEQMPYIITEIGKGLAEAFPVLLETVESLFQQIWDYISLELLNTGVSFEDAFTNMSEIFNTVWGVIQQIWVDYGQPIFDTIESVISFLAENWETIMGSISQLFDTVWNACKTAWDTIGQPIFDIIQSGLNKVKEVFDENMPKILAFFEDAVDGIEDTWENHLKPAFEAIGDFIENTLKPIFDVVFDAIGEAVGVAFDTIILAWDEVLKPAFDGICDFVSNVFAGNWSGAWEAIVSTFETVFGGIADVAKVPINWVIEYVNKAIDAINGLSFDVPNWVPGIGGEKFGFNIPNIPELAKGGVLEKGQVGLLEGTGAEAVVPLENNSGWISKVAQDLGAVTGNDAVLHEILDVLRDIKNDLPETLLDAIAALKFEISNREFARLVKAVN